MHRPPFRADHIGSLLRPPALRQAYRAFNDRALDEACFVAAGYMVHECLAVADELAKNGKRATVIDAYSLPLNTRGILDIAAKSGGRIITVEDNYTGGLDAELALAAADAGGIKVHAIYVTNIPKSGREPADVLDYVHVGRKAILEAV